MIELVPRVQQLWAIGARQGSWHRPNRSSAPGVRHQGSDRRQSRSVSPIENAYRQLRNRYDASRGRFRRRPEVPVAPQPDFSSATGPHTGEPMALRMVERTLEAMRLGRDLRPGRASVSTATRPIRRVAGSPLREDAVRPGNAGPGFHRSLFGRRRQTRPTRRTVQRDRELRPPRHEHRLRAASTRRRMPTVRARRVFSTYGAWRSSKVSSAPTTPPLRPSTSGMSTADGNFYLDEASGEAKRCQHPRISRSSNCRYRHADGQYGRGRL